MTDKYHDDEHLYWGIVSKQKFKDSRLEDLYEPILPRFEECEEFESIEISEASYPIATLKEINEYRVKISIFTFKFKMKGECINFCVKWNISLERIHYIASIWIPTEGDLWIKDMSGKEYIFEKGTWKINE